MIRSDRAGDATRKPFLPLSKLLASVLTPFRGKHSHRARADKAEQQFRLKSLPAQPLQLKRTTFSDSKSRSRVHWCGLGWASVLTHEGGGFLLSRVPQMRPHARLAKLKNKSADDHNRTKVHHVINSVSVFETTIAFKILKT